MERFSKDAKCPKCGHDKAEVRWLDVQGGQYGGRVCYAEHIQRTCLLCGYRWSEKPLDADPQEPEAQEGS